MSAGRAGRSAAACRAGSIAALAALLLGGCSTPGGAPTPAAPPPASSRPSPSRVHSAAQGQVLRVDLPRSSFGRYGRYSIYLPPGYDQHPGRRYPVVYLLHGATERDRFFLELGVREAMDRLLSDGAIGAMILVMPDGGPFFRGEGVSARSFVDFFASELVPAVDRRWRTAPDRTARAVGGISLGGLRALEIAAAHPDQFVAAGGHSAALSRASARTLAPSLAQGDVRVWLDVGERDGLVAGGQALADALTRRGDDVALQLGPGGHERPYWTAHLAEYLRFYSDSVDARARAR